MPKSPVALKQLRSPLATPRNETWQVRLDAPAQSVMTDFILRNMVTVDGSLPVDAALEVMRHAGVRSAFVIDGGQHQVLGLVTAHDIMGEKPIRYLQSIGCTHRTCSRDDVKVADVMERAEEWYVVTAADVASATVGAVLQALQHSGRTHLPVVEPAGAGRSALRGVFSRAKLLRLTEQDRRAAEAEALRPAGGV
jgi:CBS domain-containing protein